MKIQVTADRSTMEQTAIVSWSQVEMLDQNLKRMIATRLADAICNQIMSHINIKLEGDTDGYEEEEAT